MQRITDLSEVRGLLESGTKRGQLEWGGHREILEIEIVDYIGNGQIEDMTMAVAEVA